MEKPEPSSTDSARQLLLGLTVLQKRSLLQFRECPLQLLLSVHHDRSVPGHRLLERLSGDQKKSDPIIPSLYRHLVAAIEKNERAVIRFHRWRGVRPLHRFGWNRERTGRI